VLHKHDESKPLSWAIDWRELEELTLVDPDASRKSLIARGRDVSLSAEVFSDHKQARTTKIEYGFEGFRFALQPKAMVSNDFDLDVEPRDVFRFVRNKGRPWQMPGPVKSYAFPDQARTYYQNAGFLADLEARYEQLLDRIYYLGPLREHPKRDYLWAQSRPSDVGLKGENAIDAILAATAASETRNLRAKARRKPFQEMIAYWLSELGLIHSFRVKEIAEGSNRWQAIVKTRSSSSDVFLTDVGFGVSQVLPVITLLQYVPEGSTVLLEQPEIHLHPLAQAELAEVIIQAVQHRGIQVVLESHSEHLLLRLQRRIADGSLNPDEVSLYFCDAPQGQSQLTELDVDMLGRIRNWPEKFMGDAFGETAFAERARIKRMMEAK
jgi:hypothetical protein